jgi:hypothetical protein
MRRAGAAAHAECRSRSRTRRNEATGR